MFTKPVGPAEPVGTVGPVEPVEPVKSAEEKRLNSLKEKKVISEKFIGLHKDHIDVPENSKLVVGASIGENTTGRNFYDDPTFYLLGLDFKEETMEGRDRFIAADLNIFELQLKLSFVFNQKFKTVVIDWEVIKFIRGNFIKIIDVLCNMIVPGGKLIFLKGNIATLIFLENHQNPDYIIDNPVTKSKIYANIKVEPIATTIKENPEAGRVYQAFIDLKSIKENAECVIITILEPYTSKTTINEEIKSDTIEIGNRQHTQPIEWWRKNIKSGGMKHKTKKRKTRRINSKRRKSHNKRIRSV